MAGPPIVARGLAVGVVGAGGPIPGGPVPPPTEALRALARQAGVLLEQRRRERALAHAGARGGHHAVVDELTVVGRFGDAPEDLLERAGAALRAAKFGET